MTFKIEVIGQNSLFILTKYSFIKNKSNNESYLKTKVKAGRLEIE